MYILTIEDDFSSAHQLREYKGKCENLHGHNWKVVLQVKGEKLNSLGLLIDFTELKKILKNILSYLDHKNLNELEPFNTLNPSSENIARYLYDNISDELAAEHPDVAVYSVTVWESATSRCTFSR